MTNHKTQEYFFKEGCYIQEWHNTENDDSMSIARVRVVAQAVTKLHALTKTIERYVILSGSAIVTVADKSWPVTTGEVVVIGADVPQRVHNTGSQDLVFLAICTPRFREENYCQLED